MEAVAATDRPSRNNRDDDLRHEADQPLDLQDVEATQPGRIHAVRPLVLVAVLAADPLIAA